MTIFDNFILIYWSKKGKNNVYTGQGNIKDRISDHFNNTKKPFISFTYNLEPSAKKREQLEEQRIKSSNPPLNKQKKK